MEGLYLFYGQETYLLEDAIKKIKKSFDKLVEGINFIRIDETNASKLISNIETPCFGFDRKLIIVKNSGLFKKDGKRKNADISNIMDNVAKYITENIETIKLDNTVIFVEDEIEKNKLYKTI